MNLTRVIIATLCAVSSLFFDCTAQAGASKTVLYKVGVMHRQFTPPEPYDWRGAKTHALVTDIWYPADPAAVEQMQWIGSPDNPFGKAGKAAPDAPILIATPEKFPLILLSHGIGGSSTMMAWFGSALASHGYIAAAVNHPGNNALEDYTIPGAILLGTARPRPKCPPRSNARRLDFRPAHRRQAHRRSRVFSRRSHSHRNRRRHRRAFSFPGLLQVSQSRWHVP